MGGKNGGNTILNKLLNNKLFNIFEIGVLLFIICAAPPTNAAADPPAEPAHNNAAAPALPAPGTYKIDPIHSFAYFGAVHGFVGLVRGRFDKVTGTITVSQDLAACGVDVTIDTYSINTQWSERDYDLRSPAYFDVIKFPTMTYQGRGIRRVSDSSWTLDGSLTIRGVTKVVPLTFTYKGLFHHPPGEPARAAFHGTAAMKRDDFGMTRDTLGEIGPHWTGPDVEIEIDVEADEKLPAK